MIQRQTSEQNLLKVIIADHAKTDRPTLAQIISTSRTQSARLEAVPSRGRLNQGYKVETLVLLPESQPKIIDIHFQQCQGCTS